MTDQTTRTPLRRTAAALARTAAAGSLAALAVAAFAAPAQAGDDPDSGFHPPYSVRITGDSTDWTTLPTDWGFTPPYPSVRITGADNRDFTARIVSDDPETDGDSVRITYFGNRDYSVRITKDGGAGPDNRDFSVRITGDNREF
jgi:hypothetical protein